MRSVIADLKKPAGNKVLSSPFCSAIELFCIAFSISSYGFSRIIARCLLFRFGRSSSWFMKRKGRSRGGPFPLRATLEHRESGPAHPSPINSRQQHNNRHVCKPENDAHAQVVPGLQVSTSVHDGVGRRSDDQTVGQR